MSEHFALWRHVTLVCSCGHYEYPTPVEVDGTRDDRSFNKAMNHWRLHAFEEERPLEFAIAKVRGPLNWQNVEEFFPRNPYRV